MTKVYILLPVHNRKEITRLFIECLKAQSYSNYHLLLIDDGSTDGTSEMVLDYIPSATVLRGSGDWWWAGSLQKGIDWLRERKVDSDDVVLFANDDITFDADFLQKSVNVLCRHNRCLLLSKIYDAENKQINESGIHADLKSLSFLPATAGQEINCLSTRALFMKFYAIFEIGNLYPHLLPHYWSDYEFTIRAKRKGFKLLTSCESLIEINESTSGYRSFDEPTFTAFLTQYFSKKSLLNPVYKTVFICLVCSLNQSLVNIPKVWLSSFAHILKHVKTSFI